ncbi:hypothetical protein FM21_13735 [Streptomyces mutabilis]|uniref:SDR family oxidoreductase n=1 Tax=Streptomyces mutabilis TaxID=67332 RepID=A0A086N7E8_9ACTN|nr:hypothetical protein FM21_13735 [Streptomyces mutabilis]
MFLAGHDGAGVHPVEGPGGRDPAVLQLRPVVQPGPAVPVGHRGHGGVAADLGVRAHGEVADVAYRRPVVVHVVAVVDHPGTGVDHAGSPARSARARAKPGSAAPDDIAAAAAFALGRDATFITGTDLLVDGGVVAALRSGRLTSRGAPKGGGTGGR